VDEKISMGTIATCGHGAWTKDKTTQFECSVESYDMNLPHIFFDTFLSFIFSEFMAYGNA
jgi:hypothetical protein